MLFRSKHPSRPSNHTTRNCSWYQRKPEKAGPASRPAPLTGANTEPLNTQQRPENVNQVANNNNNNNAGPSRRNEYREPHQSYMIFVTEPTDKQSQHRRAMEVNAVMPAVPKFMYWSEDQITWSINDHPRVMPNPGGYALVLAPPLPHASQVW